MAAFVDAQIAGQGQTGGCQRLHLGAIQRRRVVPQVTSYFTLEPAERRRADKELGGAFPLKASILEKRHDRKLVWQQGMDSVDHTTLHAAEQWRAGARKSRSKPRGNLTDS